MKLFAAATLLAGSACAMDFRANFQKDRVVQLNVESLTESVRSLLVSHDADVFSADEGKVDVKLSPESVEALTALNVELKDTTEDWIAHFEEHLAPEVAFCQDTHENCAARDAQAFYSNYQEFDAIISRVESLAAGSSQAQVITIGRSYEGRAIRAVEIGDQSKPQGFIFCNIHAREWLSPMFCSHMVETLLADGGHPILDTFSFAIVPSANPDGYVYSRSTNNLWRKTRRPNSGSSCIGTDGNRNWDNNHCGVGSSTNPCSETYCGTAPFDNSEVAALSDYVIAQGGRTLVALDIHSYGSYLLYPYGYTSVRPPQVDFVRMQGCAQEAASAGTSVNGNTFRSGTTPELLGYTSGGTSKDYFYGELGIIYPYTVELRGSSFSPPASNIIPSNNEAFALAIGMMECVADTDLNPGNPDSPTPPPPTPAPTNPPTCGWFIC